MTNELKLSLPAEEFYRRISDVEQKYVRATIGSINGYLLNQERLPFIIAGVGSILRLENPVYAKDIDLAVVGHTCDPNARIKRHHTFNDVLDFTRLVQGYFLQLKESIPGAHKIGDGGSGYFPFSHGSGPFRGCNEGIAGTVENIPIDVISELESFGRYNSKGLQLNYEHCRPIDVQFVFNRAIEEWFEQQESGSLNEQKQRGKVSELLYAVLLEGKRS